MRCPDCSKFASMEMQDPEVNDLTVEHVGPAANPKDGEMFNVRAEVRIVRACADCGTELKEATLEMADEIAVKLPKGLTAEDVEVEEDSVEQIEEGGGRYAKSYFGATVHYKLIGAGKTLEEGELTDKIAASGMDEMV